MALPIRRKEYFKYDDNSECTLRSDPILRIFLDHPPSTHTGFTYQLTFFFLKDVALKQTVLEIFDKNEPKCIVYDEAKRTRAG